MKTFLIAALAAGLACGTASAQSTKPKAKETTGQSSKHYKPKRSADGYYRPGIPKSDPGRYNNLPGKDADYSKAYIQDH